MNRSQIAGMCNEMKALVDAHRTKHPLDIQTAPAVAIDEKTYEEAELAFFEGLLRLVRLFVPHGG